MAKRPLDPNEARIGTGNPPQDESRPSPGVGGRTPSGEKATVDNVRRKARNRVRFDLDPPVEVTEEGVIKRAVEVIGDREEAMRWLGTPIRALGYATPISRLHDEAGANDVLNVLAALEQGSW